MTKNNLRITTIPHAHLQTLTKTPAKFQNYSAKIAGGIALTRLDTIRDVQTDMRRKKNNMSPIPAGQENDKKKKQICANLRFPEFINIQFDTKIIQIGQFRKVLGS